jgi:hypothetical protein
MGISVMVLGRSRPKLASDTFEYYNVLVPVLLLAKQTTTLTWSLGREVVVNGFFKIDI